MLTDFTILKVPLPAVFVWVILLHNLTVKVRVYICKIFLVPLVRIEMSSRVWFNIKLWRKKYNNVLWKVVFTVQLLVISLVLYRLASVLIGGGLTYKQFHNNYCRNNINNTHNAHGVRLNETNDHPCEYDYNFKKVHHLNVIITIH